MKIPYKIFVTFNALIVLSLIAFSFYYVTTSFNFAVDDLAYISCVMGIFVALVILYFPVLLLMKSRTEGFVGLPLKKLVFATHPSMSSQIISGLLPSQMGLAQKLEIFLHEEKRLNPAPVWKRFAAYGLDIVWLFVIIIPFIIISAIINTPYLPSDSKALITFIVSLSSLLVLFVVYLFIRDGFNGQSFGKRIMKIQVIDIKTGQPIGFGKSALRYLFLRIFSIFEVWPLIYQPNHRRMGDYFANTMVVDK